MPQCDLNYMLCNLGGWLLATQELAHEIFAI